MKRDLSTLYIYLLDRDRLECVALPKKGRLSQADKARENEAAQRKRGPYKKAA